MESNSFLAPPPKRRQSILKSGNSIRPDDTECIDITTGFTGAQKLDATTTVPPRRVSFFDVPQVMDISPAHMSSDSHNQDSSVDEMNKTFACNVPMEMSGANANPDHTTCYDTMDMSLCEDAVNENVAPQKSSTFNAQPSEAGENRTVQTAIQMNRTCTFSVPMEMSVAHGNPAHAHTTCYETMDMSVYDEAGNENKAAATGRSVYRGQPSDAHESRAGPTAGQMNRTCTSRLPMDMSIINQTNANFKTYNETTDMSFGDSVSENLSHTHNPVPQPSLPLPAPQQPQPQRLVHPSEISTRSNVLPSKYQPARVVQMNAAPNLVADNSQYVKFLLRNPVSTASQSSSYPAPTYGYGQFGSAKTPRKGWDPQQRNAAPMASQPQHQFPEPLIQKVFLNSVEVQTSPLTTFVSKGTSITPKTPQQKTPRFLARRDFQQQTSKNSTPEMFPPPAEEAEELQVLAPAAPPPRNQETPEQEQEHLADLPVRPPVDSAEMRRANQRRRETYTVQKSVPPQHIEVDGERQDSMPERGILDTSNVSYASTLSFSEPDPIDVDREQEIYIDDTHQIEGRLLSRQQKSMNSTTIGGSAVDKTERSIEEVRLSLESQPNSTEHGNGGVKEILPCQMPAPIPEGRDYPDFPDQSNTTFNVCNNTALTQEILRGPGLGPGASKNATFDRSVAYQAQARSMTSALNSSQANAFGLTEEVLPPQIVMNNGGNLTFRTETNTTITQEMSITVSGRQQREERPNTVPAMTSFSVIDHSARDLMPPPTPRGRPMPAMTGVMTPQPKPNSSMQMSITAGLGPPSAKKRNLDLSISNCRDPHELSFRAWESHLGQKTRHYLKNYGTMSGCTKARQWAPVREELLRLDRVDFEKFTEDFAHAFPEWYLRAVLAYFESQELAAIPLSELDTHPAILKITGGPDVTRTSTLEEVLASLGLGF